MDKQIVLHIPLPNLLLVLLLPLCCAVLYLVAVTAAAPSAAAALGALDQQGELAMALLRSQLMDTRKQQALPASVNLVLSQSPLLIGGREEVLSLRSRQESDTPLPDTREEPPAVTEDISPLPETPAEPVTPLIFAENGVPARTLIPTSEKGTTESSEKWIPPPRTATPKWERAVAATRVS